jgi:hypothetical protein
MSKKLIKIFAVVALLAAAPGTALAYHGGWHGGGHWHGGWHGGWRGGGWGWGWGGPSVYLGWGYPGYYADPYYYAPPPEECGWVRIRYWRYGHWHVRRVWRCW